MSAEPSDLPQQGHSHGKPADIRDFFRQEDLAQQYNLHQEANKIDLASVTDEIVLSKDGADGARDAGASVQLETERLHNPGLPGQLAPATGHRVDTALTVAQQEVLLGWLEAADEDADEQALALLRRQLAGVIADLPELLRRYLDRLAGAVVEATGRRPRADRDPWTSGSGPTWRRRCAGWPASCAAPRTSRQRNTARGRVNPGRTMRKNMRYDGIPFQPVTTSRAADKPRLLLLTDVSLSVRTTARFTLHLVYGMQSLFTQARSFAFVDAPVEITELFAEHPLERALGLVFDGLPAGGLLDVDASSDYGATFTQLLSEHSAALGSPHHAHRARGRARQRQRRPAGHLPGDHPQGSRDDLADPGAPVLLGARGVRPAALRGVLRPRPGGRRSHRAAARGPADIGGGDRTMSEPNLIPSLPQTIDPFAPCPPAATTTISSASCAPSRLAAAPRTPVPWSAPTTSA